MMILAIIGVILFVVSGIMSGISLFGGIYHKISARTNKILSDISFGLLCISGIFTWTFFILQF